MKIAALSNSNGAIWRARRKEKVSGYSLSLKTLQSPTFIILLSLAKAVRYQ